MVLRKFESIWMPATAAADAHWCFRCSVGVTMVTASIVRSDSSSAAIRRPNTVLPAPGVATARKSLGRFVRYLVSARRCHARSGRAVESFSAGGAPSCVPVMPVPLAQLPLKCFDVRKPSLWYRLRRQSQR